MPVADTRAMLIVRAFRSSERLQSIPILITLPASPADLTDLLCLEYLDTLESSVSPPLFFLRYPVSFAELVQRADRLLGRQSKDCIILGV